MTSDAVKILQMLFGSVWSLFTSFHIPGTRSTPAAWFFFVLFFGLLWRFVGRILGIAVGAGERQVRHDRIKSEREGRSK